MRFQLLIVEDSVSHLEVLADHLADDHDVIVATSGEQALDLLRGETLPELVLLDVVMPGIDGFEVCRRMRADDRLRDIPVIFITAAAAAEGESRALACGGADFIPKPVSRDVLLARVSQQLNLLHQRRQLEVLNRQLNVMLDEVHQARSRLQVLATAQEHSPTAFIITDPAGLIEHGNPAFQRQSGLSLADLRGRPLDFAVDDGRSGPAREALRQAIAEGTAWQGELWCRRAGQPADQRVVACWLVPVHNAHGRLQRYVCSQQDVTEQRLAEIEVRQRRQEEVLVTATIQRTMLLGALPERTTGCEIHTWSQATQVLDGDFYGFLKIDDDRFEVVCGDVMGKGLIAAMAGAAVKQAYFQAWTELQLQCPGDLPDLADVVNDMHRRVGPHLMELGVFVTMTAWRVDRRAGRLTAVNAGHTPLLHLRAADGRLQDLLGDHPPLAVLPDEHYTAQHIALEPGDLVAVYSDGLSDAADAEGQLFGDAGLRAALARGHAQRQPPGAIVQHVMDAWDAHRDPSRSGDDTTVIVLRAGDRSAPAQPHCVDRRFDADLAELTNVRAWLETHLPLDDEASKEHHTAMSVLAAVEGFTNIVRHARGLDTAAGVQARLESHGGRIGLTLCYRAEPWAPEPRPASPPPVWAEGGRGLHLMDSLCDGVQVDCANGQNRLRLDFRMAGSACGPAAAGPHGRPSTRR